MVDLRSKIQKLSGITDNQYFDFYFNKLLDCDDEGVVDLIKEAFVLLKLAHGEECPDYDGIRARRELVASQKEESERVEHDETYKKFYEKLDTHAMMIADIISDFSAIVKRVKAMEIVSADPSLSEEELGKVVFLTNNGWLKKAFFSNQLILHYRAAFSFGSASAMFQCLPWGKFVNKDKIVDELAKMYEIRTREIKRKEERDERFRNSNYSIDDVYIHRRHSNNDFEKLKEEVTEKLHKQINYYLDMD